MASCDANISTNGMTWPETSCFTSVQSSWPNKCNDAIDSIACCLYKSQWQHLIKCKVAPHFNHIDKRNGMVPSMMWPVSCDWHQCQWHNMTKLHLISVVLTQRIKWWHLQCHWHHVMPSLVPIYKECTKTYVLPHFYHFKLINAVLPLTTALAHQRYSRHC